MKSRNTEGDRRLLLTIFYSGPWERLSNWCYGIRKDSELRWTIPHDPKGWRWLLAWIGDFCEARDHAWQKRYTRTGRTPHDRWKRRGQ